SVCGILIYCADFRSHGVAMNADRWADDLRLSDLEPRFVCKACGKRGAILRGGSDSVITSGREEEAANRSGLTFPKAGPRFAPDSSRPSEPGCPWLARR